MKIFFKISVVILFLTGCRHPARHIEIPAVFSDNMVMQRDKDIIIWGKSEKYSYVTVELNSVSQQTETNDSGLWKVIFPPMKAGGPYTLKITGKEIITIRRVMIGEVWLMTGSNDIAQTIFYDSVSKPLYYAPDTNLHFLSIGYNVSFKPEFQIKSNGWFTFHPDSSLRVFSLGYHLARKLYDSLHVPIGIIQSAYFFSRTESWICRDSLAVYPSFQKLLHLIALHNKAAVNISRNLLIKKYDEKVVQWEDSINSILHDEVETDTQFINTIHPEKWKKMKLPVKWESAGLSYYDGLVWFVRDIAVPSNWIGKDITVKLGCIDDVDMTYIDRKKIGSSAQCEEKRNYLVHPGSFHKNKIRIAIKVIDAGGGGGFTGIPSDMALICGNDSVSLAGYWHYVADFSYHGIPDRPHRSYPQYIPTALYNGMIHPIIPYGIKGVVCNQGNANYLDPYLYRHLIKTLINSWRAEWNQKDLPFIIIQLGCVEKAESYPELREAQYLASLLPSTDIVCTIDLLKDEKNYIAMHRLVGTRMTNTLLNKIYGRPTPFSGPRYKEHKCVGNEVQIVFETFGKQLIILHDKKLKGFEIAGSDAVYRNANAVIQNNTVICWNDSVKYPVAIRYAWHPSPDATLYDTDSLPAFPFKTDNWYRIRVEKDFEAEYLEELLE